MSFRDELCRNGDLLNSPALNYTLFDLSTAVNTLRDLKSTEEQIEGPIKEEENETIPVEESLKVRGHLFLPDINLSSPYQMRINSGCFMRVGLGG